MKAFPPPNLSAGDWLTARHFAALLGLLIFASHPDVVLGQATFFIRDFCQFGYPLAFHFRESFWRGEIPLWNPYNHCGMPFLAQWNTLVLYPGSLFYLLLPLSWALGVFCLLHQFLGGLGMFFLCRRWTTNPLAAAVAGVAFAFNGFTLNCLMWPNYIVVLGWLPWVILTVEQAWRRGGRSVIVAGLVGAMQMLGGAPELILLTWGVVGCLWLMAMVRGESGRWTMLLRFAAVVALVAGLSAAQLLPFLDLLRHSQRQAEYASSDWSMPATGWANLVLPLFDCVRTKAGIYLQPNQGFTSSYYPGIGALALAIFALGRGHDRRVWLLGALCLVGLFLAWGEHGYVYGWLRQAGVPLGMMRYPIKFVMLAAIVLPLLAGLGMHAWLKTGDTDRRAGWLLKGTCLLLLGLIAWLLWRAHGQPDASEPWANLAENGLGRAVFLILTVLALLMLVKVTQQKRAILLTLGLMLVLWLDGATHMPRQNPTVARAVYQPNLQPTQELNPPVGLGKARAVLSADSWKRFNQVFVSDPFNMVLALRLGLNANCNLLDAAQKADGFYSLTFRQQVEALSLIALLGCDTLPGLADFMSVGQVNIVVNREVAATNGEPARTVETFDWTARPTWMPLLTAGQQPVFAGAERSLDFLRDPSFDYRRFVVLQAEAAGQLQITNQSEARVLEQRVAAHRITARIQASAPAIVVVSQAFYHPWRVAVDGQPTRLWRANHAFQAFEIPAGRHEVLMEYVDWGFRIGLAISLGTLIFCGVIWAQQGKRVRTQLPNNAS